MYGRFLHLQNVHQTIRPSWMNLLMNCLPNGPTTQQIDPGGQTVLRTEQPPWDGVENAPTGSKNKCLTPCAIHVCELAFLLTVAIETSGA